MGMRLFNGNQDGIHIQLREKLGCIRSRCATLLSERLVWQTSDYTLTPKGASNQHDVNSGLTLYVHHYVHHQDHQESWATTMVSLPLSSDEKIVWKDNVHGGYGERRTLRSHLSRVKVAWLMSTLVTFWYFGIFPAGFVRAAQQLIPSRCLRPSKTSSGISGRFY